MEALQVLLCFFQILHIRIEVTGTLAWLNYSFKSAVEGLVVWHQLLTVIMMIYHTGCFCKQRVAHPLCCVAVLSVTAAAPLLLLLLPQAVDSQLDQHP